MKKGRLVIAVVAVAMLSLASCKKDFVCECKQNGQTFEYTLTDSKKAAAAAVCEGEGIGGYEMDGEPLEMPESNCSLK